MSNPEILNYFQRDRSRSTVKRHYRRWRREHGLPDRCDNAKCFYHQGPLIWIGLPVPLILDHVNGNRRDSRPENLRYLCPTCAQQLDTHGGLNRGRVMKSFEDGFLLKAQNGRADYNFFLADRLVHCDAFELSLSTVPTCHDAASTDICRRGF